MIVLGWIVVIVAYVLPTIISLDFLYAARKTDMEDLGYSGCPLGWVLVFLFIAMCPVVNLVIAITFAAGDHSNVEDLIKGWYKYSIISKFLSIKV
jgi:hypothetical protein